MKPTLHFAGETTPADVFFTRYGRAAAALHACGIGERDVFALMLRNEPVTLEVILAGRWLGARWCMINWHFKAHEVRHILADSGAKVLIVHADLLEAIAASIPPGVKVFVVAPEAATRTAFGLGQGPWPAAQGASDWAQFRDATPHPPVAQKTPGSAMLYTSGTTGLPKGIARDAATPEQVQATLQISRVVLGVEQIGRAHV